jgi:hypothetical protein|tara:strand:- start:352 stop:567 length:216 start_codon:yes stop_codon:yes gene_type:complete
MVLREMRDAFFLSLTLCWVLGLSFDDQKKKNSVQHARIAFETSACANDNVFLPRFNTCKASSVVAVVIASE